MASEREKWFERLREMAGCVEVYYLNRLSAAGTPFLIKEEADLMMPLPITTIT